MTPPVRAATLAIAVVCLLVNLPALRPGFIHDDHRIIEQNDRIRALDRLPQIVSGGYWPPGDVAGPPLYRPFTLLTFALNYAVDGLRPFGYRLVDLLLHALNAVLVFRLAGRLFAPVAPGASGVGRPLGAPLLAGLLFAVHPAHTEALGEVVGRAEILAAAGTLGSVLAFLRGREAGAGAGEVVPGAGRGAGAWPWYSVSLGLLVLGCLSKETAAITPVLLLLADLLLSGRRPAHVFHLASFATLGGLLALRHAVLAGAGPVAPTPFLDNPIVGYPFLQGRLTALKVIARYALLLVWPARLSIDYSYASIPPATGALDSSALAGGAIVLAWGAAVVGCWRRSPAVAFALAWIGAVFAPVSNLLFPIGTLMAERLLYLPSVGFCVVAADALVRAARWADARRRGAGAVALVAAGLVLTALAARTVTRLRDWRDDYTIFRSALQVSPDNVRALFNYGSACEDRGDDDAALDAYTRAVGLLGDFADAQYNLAGVLARRKRWDEAVRHYEAALRLQPGNVQYLVNQAHSLVALGRYPEARDALQRALAIDPGSAVGYTNLGALELAQGDRAAALRAYEEAARLDPESADALRNLAVAQHEAGDARSVGTFRQALAIRPDDADLLDGLGLSLLDAGDAGAARDTIGRAVSARPAHPVYRYHLARALEGTNDLPGAAAQYREAIRLAPAVPVPYRNLGLLLERMGDHAGALAALERAAELDPKGAVMDEPARALLSALRRRGRAG